MQKLQKKGKKMKIIAIDGSSSAGKGTLSARLAAYLDFAYLDTGALYRSVAYEMLENGIDPSCEEQAVKIVQSFNPAQMLLLQENPAIRTDVCAIASSKVAVLPQVRHALLQFQRRFAKNPVKKDGALAKGAIIDGRDIGTVVCQDADLKVFLIANAEVRAKRRFKELQLKEKCVIFENVLSDIIARDKRDSERTISPLKPADDALVIDTSDMTPDDVFALVISKIEKSK